MNGRGFPRAAARVLGEVEAIVDWARQRVRGERGRGPFRIVPYRGHGTDRFYRLRARVLEGDPIPKAREEDSVWRNLLHSLRRIESDEVPAARVRARVGSVTVEGLADDEGFLDLRLRCDEGFPAGEIWRPVELEVVDPVEPGAAPARCTGRVLVPTASARFGVISDIDDTVVKTDVANLLSMARLVLLTNAHTRLPFEGVAAFYRALHGGATGTETNPIFYVSSSPWNFYDLLDEVLAVHGIPAGPLFLKDYGISRRLLLSLGHRDHKLTAIREILDTHPGLPFVLIGDSGQEDPEIYREVVREYPGRVRAIYIRDVSPPARDREVHAIAEEVGAAGVEMVLVTDTIAAARHALDHGLIRPSLLPEIVGEKAEDEAAPGPIESILKPDET